MSAIKRYTAKNIFGSFLWAMLGLAIVVLLGAAISLKNSKHCKAVQINISGIQNNFFIDKKEISNILEELCVGKLIGKPIGSFNLGAIEKTLQKNQWIKNAELFFDNNEVLRVDVIEREPVARIFTNAGSSFYLDSTLTKLPLSDKSSARVPVFTNFPSQSLLLTKTDSNLLVAVKNISVYILNDPFWMAQIDQVDITPERNFEMIPKVGNQTIVFGSADNYKEKFNNLLTFYKQVATKVGWNKYSKVNVQYKNQVVGVKRGTEDIVQDLLQTKLIMQNIVINAQKQSSDSIKNIQMDQQPEDNIIPVAPQLEDFPDEKTVTEKPKPAIAEPEKTIPSSNEKPVPNPFLKTVAPAKKPSPGEIPFWLQSVNDKPSLNQKNNKSKKDISNSTEKPIPISDQKNNVLKSTTKINKKQTIKSIIKPAKPIIKPTKKPKAVMPPPNDY